MITNMVVGFRDLRQGNGSRVILGREKGSKVSCIGREVV